MKRMIKILCILLVLALILILCTSCGNSKDTFVDIVRSSCMDGYDGFTYQEVLENAAENGTVLWYYSEKITEYERMSENENGKTIIGPFDKGNYVEAAWFDEEMNHKRFFFEIDDEENVILLGMPDSSGQTIIGGDALMYAMYYGYVDLGLE